MNKIEYTERGFDFVKVSPLDIINWGGFCVCNGCNGQFLEEDMYLVYVLGDCYCGQPYCKGYRCLDLDDLLRENQELKEKLDKYENPEDMTLLAMWCTEKVKDENKKLKKQLEESKNLKNKLLVYNASIKGNWNKLKEYVSAEWYCYDNDSVEFEVAKDVLNKMQELEGSDSNE